MLKSTIKRAFRLVVYTRFLFLLSSPLDTCAIVSQMYRPSQTPHLTMSKRKIAEGKPNAYFKNRIMVKGVACEEGDRCRNTVLPPRMWSTSTLTVLSFQVYKQRDVRSSGISRSTCVSRLCYIFEISSQCQNRVRLNRVFFPRIHCKARSLCCCFARLKIGTVRTTLFHSCASPIK